MNRMNIYIVYGVLLKSWMGRFNVQPLFCFSSWCLTSRKGVPKPVPKKIMKFKVRRYLFWIWNGRFEPGGSTPWPLRRAIDVENWRVAAFTKDRANTVILDLEF